MRSTVKKFLVALVGLGIIFSGMALGHGRGGPGWENKHDKQNHGARCHCGAKRVIIPIFHQAKLETLSELSGQPLEKVKKDIQAKPCCLILEEYKIKASDYYKNLKAKKLSLINKAEKEGKITALQKDKAIQKINNPRFGHSPKMMRGCRW